MSENRRYINYEDFELQKLSYNEKQGLLAIDWNEKTGSKDFHADKSKEVPHPDLLTAISALGPHLARVLGLQQGWDFAREATRNDLDVLKGATQGAKDADASIKVMSITMMGEGETLGVKIAGFLDCLNGKMKVNCPVIRFASEAMYIEKTVEKLVEDIRTEAYGFLFQQKRKQYTIEEQQEIEDKKNKKNRAGRGQTSILDENQKQPEASDDNTPETEESTGD